MVHTVYINDNTTLCLPTNEYFRQDASDDCDIGYIMNIIYNAEGTPVDFKDLRNKGYVKLFQQVHL